MGHIFGWRGFVAYSLGLGFLKGGKEAKAWPVPCKGGHDRVLTFLFQSDAHTLVMAIARSYR